MSERSPLCRHEALREECAICKPFRDASARRRANGIRLRRITLLAEESQVEAFNILWESYVERFGKNKAVDVLLKLMSEVETRIREQENEHTSKKP